MNKGNGCTARSRTLFIGELPPPFNGVSVKDKLMYEQIFRDIGARMIDMVECRRKPWKIPLISVRLIMGMLRSNVVIIGMGSTSRRKILLGLQKVLTGRAGLKKIMLIVMGGQFHEQVMKDGKLCDLLKNIGSVWVESEIMINGLKEQGISQVYLFPNCRTEEGALAPIDNSAGEPLKLVYFSGVNCEHGMDDVIKSFTYLNADTQRITLDVYGTVEDDVQEDFVKFVHEHDNVQYHGVYDTSKGNTYAMLHQYDVMLRPSKRDGVAGALVESKMAGITAIVSNSGFNSEVVHNGEEGIVIQQPLAENLAKAIRRLNDDRALLKKLKKGAYESRRRYCVSTYCQQMIECALHDTMLQSD